ncbi:MAG: carbon storage regulator, partial [Planctomycetota bacterium]
MLVLSRKSGERIHIGGDIVVEVRKVAGNRVTLAVEAPKEVRILRGELRDAAAAFEQQPGEPVATSPSQESKSYVVTHHRIS